MTAGIFNLTVEQNSTWHFEFTWKDSLGAPVDLSGFTAALQVRPHQTSDVLLLDLSSESPGMTDTFIQAITLDGNSDPNVIIEVDEAVMQALDFPGKARYDLILTNAGATDIQRKLMGTFKLSFGVTRV